ncbi:MAG: bifunctional riboflavin kinase/FAD synthetase [Galactobacter sp.]|uniref:bifunctional riboflavin kinase/FAD synthetase n=1 Tax=Galactobacter sp. TaxID=2676125 RepID=UPI0025C0EB0C|nr:bifunctional riboflavin kinase/FAD synthetase [Galactobacter sp.]
MLRWTSPDQVPDLPGSVVTIGNFDGVHRGHQELLRSVVAAAKDRDCLSVVVTFDPHPLAVHSPAFAPVPITSRAGREALLEREGVGALLTIEYTLDFAAQTAEEFVRRYLVQTLHAHVVVVGRDVRFGKDNEGNLDTMRVLGQKYGFEVVGVSDVGTERRWSSTWVREALQHGNVEEAARVLGRYHSMAGTVVHGFARGRELGFPTANLSSDAVGLMPADGVYAGWLVDQQGTRWPSAISIGTNPQFDGVVRTVEAHVIDRPDEAVTAFDLYDQRVQVEFVAHLRGMVAFNGLDALVEQMHRDVDRAREALTSEPQAGVEAEAQA